MYHTWLEKYRRLFWGLKITASKGQNVMYGNGKESLRGGI